MTLRSGASTLLTCLAIALLSTACGSSNNDGGGPPAAVPSNVRVVSDFELQSATIQPASLVFPLSGNDALAQTMPGAILVSGSNGGLLRKVNSVSVSSSEITFQTTDAALTDAVSSGHMQRTINFNPNCASQGGAVVDCPDLTGMLPLTVELSGTILYEQDGVSVVITSGTITYDAIYSLSLDIDGATVTDFQAQLDGPVTASLQLAITASSSTTVSLQKNLWTSPSLNYSQLIGAVPVGESVSAGLDATIVLSGGASDSVTGGYSGSGQLTMGVQYNSGAWSGTGSQSIAFSPTPPVFQASESLSAAVTLTPHVDLTFFALNSQVANATAIVSADVTGNLDATYDLFTCLPDIDWTTSASVSATATGNLSVLNTALGSFSKSLFSQDFSLGAGTAPLFGADGGACDAGMDDAGMPDAGTADAGMPDAGMPDAGTPDAGPAVWGSSNWDQAAWQ